MHSLLPLSLLAGLAAALPSPLRFPNVFSDLTPCTEPAIRKEWRTLSADEQKGYLDAAVCMFNTPGIGSSYFAPIKHRYDDFVALHINASQGLFEGTGGIHQVGVFLPWHRMMIGLWEKTLQTECGFTGSLPYWDWTQDAADLTKSPLLQADAWGTNGALIANHSGGPSDMGSSTSPVIVGGTGGGCISDGAFKDVQLNVGPGPDPTVSNTRCISRDFHPDVAADHMNASVVESIMSNDNFFDFRAELDPVNTFQQTPPMVQGIHGGGHLSIGAEMFDLFSSPSEPIFYMHHAFLDRLWTNWQEQDTAKRLTDISGPSIPNTVNNGTTTLDSMLWFGEFMAPSVPVSAVMDTQSRYEGGAHHIPLCYKYDDTSA